MTPKQAAALRIAQECVSLQGGDPNAVRLHPGMGRLVAQYRWVGPDGTVLSVGWEAADFNDAFAERKAMGFTV